MLRILEGLGANDRNSYEIFQTTVAGIVVDFIREIVVSSNVYHGGCCDYFNFNPQNRNHL